MVSYSHARGEGNAVVRVLCAPDRDLCMSVLPGATGGACERQTCHAGGVLGFHLRTCWIPPASLRKFGLCGSLYRWVGQPGSRDSPGRPWVFDHCGHFISRSCVSARQQAWLRCPMVARLSYALGWVAIFDIGARHLSPRCVFVSHCQLDIALVLAHGIMRANLGGTRPPDKIRPSGALLNL